MKSNVYELERLDSDYREIPAETEKVAKYRGLDSKSTMRLRLLAEEMICMLPQLLIYGKGRFWIENEGEDFELHLSVEPFDMSEADDDAEDAAPYVDAEISELNKWIKKYFPIFFASSVSIFNHLNMCFL